MKQNLKHLPFIIIILLAFGLRFINLGFSDYQGDEIKALFLPEESQSVSQFLLDQRKGPMQFLITFLLKFINPTYDNEFLIRFPFALAGAFSIIFFYKFVKAHFGRKVAFYSSFFLSTNGFFVGLSRIVQYQPFVWVFMTLSLYLFTLAIKSEKWRIKGVYLGFISWSLSILSHYDGIFIFPIAGYLLWVWFTQNKKELKHLIYSFLLFALLLAAFYLPFILSISVATRSYWENRLSGGDGKISSSKYLFQVYNPIYIIHLYNVLLGFSIIKFFRKNIPLIFVAIWAVIPFIFLEVIVNIPGTHIFTYLMPLTILLAQGILVIESIVVKMFSKFKIPEKLSTSINYLGITLIFLFVLAQSYLIFVDNKVEYPWTSEKFLIWEFHMPSPVFHLSMFGFPYYRGWEEIKSFVEEPTVALACPRYIDDCYSEVTREEKYYSTNERESISRYYINYRKETNLAGYYIHIINPQSFTEHILHEKAKYWSENYLPVKVIKSGHKDLARIYYMPTGSLEEIKLLGY